MISKVLKISTTYTYQESSTRSRDVVATQNPIRTHFGRCAFRIWLLQKVGFLEVPHSLRTRGRNGKEPPLSQHPLHRKVLDVGVFYRFNDPVLQAAFLRAATPAELDYSNSDIGNQSANARLLLLRIFKDPLAPAIEFALALAVRRLRITEDDKALVLAEVDGLKKLLSSVTMAFLNTWRSS